MYIVFITTFLEGLIENPSYVEAWACSEFCFNYQYSWCVKCIFVQNLIQEFGRVFEENITNFESNAHGILNGIQNFKLLYH